jgi:hypothetical protein
MESRTQRCNVQATVPLESHLDDGVEMLPHAAIQ